jgi:hypothetical protein
MLVTGTLASLKDKATLSGAEAADGPGRQWREDAADGEATQPVEGREVAFGKESLAGAFRTGWTGHGRAPYLEGVAAVETWAGASEATRSDPRWCTTGWLARGPIQSKVAPVTFVADAASILAPSAAPPPQRPCAGPVSARAGKDPSRQRLSLKLLARDPSRSRHWRCVATSQQQTGTPRTPSSLRDHEQV